MEVPMPSPTQPARRRLRSVLLSLLVHSTVLALALFVATATRIRIVPSHPRQTLALLEIAGGAHAIPIPLPRADFAAHTRNPTPEHAASRKTILPVQSAQKNGGGAPPAPHAGDGSGPAARGNGGDAHDVHPTFPVFSPQPPVKDRSLLPAAEAKVIVDVDVDAFGQVTRETLVQGVSAKLDRIVLDVVTTWRFQPATVDGKPVASTAQLIFPFTPKYPLTTGS
jgi:TonB family protein